MLDETIPITELERGNVRWIDERVERDTHGIVVVGRYGVCDETKVWDRNRGHIEVYLFFLSFL